MQTKPQLKKELVVGILVLLIMNVAPLASNSSGTVIPATGYVVNNHSRDLPCYPIFNGTKCAGGWFITPVNTSFVYDNLTVNKIYYSINYEPFLLYENPFVIYEEGQVIFSWYWIDNNGTVWPPFGTLFKVDHTPPLCNISIPEKGGFYFFNKMLFQHQGGATVTIGRITFLVDAWDHYSGVEKVNFSLTKVGGTKSETYEVNNGLYIWNLEKMNVGRYILTVTAYDNGGLFSTAKLDLIIFYLGF